MRKVPSGIPGSKFFPLPPAITRTLEAKGAAGIPSEVLKLESPAFFA